MNVWCCFNINCANNSISAPRTVLQSYTPSPWWSVGMQNSFGSLTDLKAPKWAHSKQNKLFQLLQYACFLSAKDFWLPYFKGNTVWGEHLWGEDSKGNVATKEPWTWNVFVKCQATYALGHGVTEKQNWSTAVSRAVSRDFFTLWGPFPHLSPMLFLHPVLGQSGRESFDIQNEECRFELIPTLSLAIDSA